MKTCNNCKFEGNKGCCDTCSICDDTFSNWQSLPMEEIKVEDYEVTTQADGLVHLMRKVDEFSFDAMMDKLQIVEDLGTR